MSLSTFGMLTPTIAQSMGIDAWGWVKFSLIFLSVICLLIQLCLLVAYYGEKQVPSIVPSATGFVSTLFVFILVFLHGGTGWDFVIFFTSIFSLMLLMHAFLIVLIKKLEVKYRKKQLVPSCNQCDYNLTDNVTGQCPECGEPIPTHLKARVLLKRIEKFV